MANSKTRRKLNKGSFHQLTGDPALFIGVILILASLILFIVYPLYAAAKLSLSNEGIFSLSEYKYIFTHSYYQKSILNSIMLGTIVATVATFIGFIFAYAIAKGSIKGQKFIQPMAILPIISPPFMFALSVILLFGRNGLITAKLLHLDTAGVYGLKGLIIVQVITMYPIAYMTLVGIIQAIDPDLETCSMNLGAKRIKLSFQLLCLLLYRVSLHPGFLFL